MVHAIPVSRHTFGLARLRIALLVLQVAIIAAVGIVEPAGLVDAVANLVCAAVPVAIASLGRMRLVVALVWSVVLVGIAFAVADSFAQSIEGPSGADAFMQAIVLLQGTTILLFVCHSFVVAGEMDRRWIASYPTYIDTAWTLCVQTLLLAAGFALFGAAYGLIWWLSDKVGLDGAEIGTKFMRWGFFPAMSVLTLFVVEFSERRPALIRTLRSAVQELLSWLLPLAVLWAILALAKVALHDPRQLWLDPDEITTRPLAMFGIVILINAQFRDGGSPADRFRLLTIARLLAVGLLLVMIVLQATDLALRFLDHQWTPGIVQGVATLMVLGCYAIGYAATTVTSGKAMRHLPGINIVAALLGVGLSCAMATPLFSPTRLAVAYQIARLEAGEITPDKFDYELLAFHAVPYGRPALQQLVDKPSGPDGDDIARRARSALTADPRRRH